MIEQSKQFQIVGILDTLENVGHTILAYDIIGTDEKIDELVAEECEFLVTVGQIRSPKVREKLFAKLQASNAKIATVISPRAYVSPYATVGVGTIVMHDVLINADVQIGLNCIINSKALIEHDVLIEDHCHISTAAVLNGGVKVKEGTFFGSNAVSKEAVSTSKEAFIKAGSLFLG
ncbi:MAG: sugar O-acyltransferase (sialic acid O-acetyltransferase NeuD family) [Oleiphilaceae bacterium]